MRSRKGERVFEAVRGSEPRQAAVEQYQRFVEQIDAGTDVHVRNRVGQENSLDSAVGPHTQFGSAVRAQPRPTTERAGQGRVLPLDGECPELHGIARGRRPEIRRDSDRNPLIPQRADGFVRHRGTLKRHGVKAAQAVGTEVCSDPVGHDYVLLLGISTVDASGLTGAVGRPKSSMRDGCVDSQRADR